MRFPRFGASEKRKDRRAADRYPVFDTVFITVGPRFDVVGCLIDLSRSGLSFTYNAFEPAGLTGSLNVDIHCKPRKLNLASISCRVAYDVKMQDAPSFGGFQIRRCGIRFDPLSSEQEVQLESFLRSCRTDSRAGGPLRPL